MTLLAGIDYLHPDLGGGFGPGYRVITGYDYVGDAGVRRSSVTASDTQDLKSRPCWHDVGSASCASTRSQYMLDYQVVIPWLDCPVAHQHCCVVRRIVSSGVMRSA